MAIIERDIALITYQNSSGIIMNKRLDKIARNIIDSIGNKQEVQHFDSSPLPEREKIHAVMDDIFVLLFPGYYGQANMSFDSIEMRIGYRVARVYEELKPQISRELIHECQKNDDLCKNCNEASTGTVLRFLESVPELRSQLNLDIKAAFKNDPAAVDFNEIIFSYPGFSAITVYRVANYFYRSGLRLIPRIMTELAHSKTGIDIHPGASIGKGFFIDHGTGVVIGETSIIGDNVTIYQGVTLGALNFPRDSTGEVIRLERRHPKICDSVVIYAGATILGGETIIGENSVIGGNVWLTSSVPANTRVILKKTDYQTSPRKIGD